MLESSINVNIFVPHVKDERELGNSSGFSQLLSSLSLNLNKIVYYVSYINGSDKGYKMTFLTMLFKRESTKDFTC